MAFSPHITGRSFWCKQSSLPLQATREAYNARFLSLPQYDMWIASCVRYSVFFGKPPQKASGISHHIFLSKQPGGEASEVRYPAFFSKLSRQKLRA